MSKKVIEINNLTKSYGLKKGVFDLSFDIHENEVFGFIGPNGAGKTTTIRQLLGFIYPDSGHATINGLDIYDDSDLIKKTLGYLPGEITFFDNLKGFEFLKLMADLRGLKDLTYMNELVIYFDLDLGSKIKKMSKGMKQKLGLVSCFMHDPKVLILDEPTSGLDPLMQKKFVDLILKEKEKGKTILMSSHSFEEVERTCDRVLMIKEGSLVVLEHISKLKENMRKAYIVRFHDEWELCSFMKNNFTYHKNSQLEIEVIISGDVDELIKALSIYKIESIDIKKQTIEEVFMGYYKVGGSHE
ncbi:MAG TPA: ABC transporter ATP-binding protein [Acholeplasma sp.]|nr:ABC transporter ATP-binding protein [Acholeplasma sp.]